jgi:low affinity Fe/Cu permease
MNRGYAACCIPRMTSPDDATRPWFLVFSRRLAVLTGRAGAFIAAVALIIGWLASGPLFGFDDTWQLVINTATTIITFLMVFLIQNTQNRDTEAIQIKLDELIRATRGAQNSLLDLEELSEEELDAHRERYEELARIAKQKQKGGGPAGDLEYAQRKEG